VSSRWSLWMVLASLAFLVSIVAAWWRESHQPWQSWQARAYRLQAAQLATQIANELDSGTRASLEAKRAEVLKAQPHIVTLIPQQTNKPELCLTCHTGIEDISPSHPAEAIGCVMCHGGDPLALDADRAHAGMHGGRNPGDLSVAQQACGQPQCHAGFSDSTRNHIERVTHSLQATYASAIAQVRFTFGAQPDNRARLGIAAVSDHSPTIPSYALRSLGKFDLSKETSPGVRKFATDCLNCHLSAPIVMSLNKAYFYRSTGCSACHYLYADDGLYRGLDPTVSRDPLSGAGHGTTHRLTTQIPYSQCNHCHNRGNYSLKQMTFLERDDLYPAQLAGLSTPDRRLRDYYQPIAQFVSCEWILDCVDCHTSAEAMGDGHIYGTKKDAAYHQCKTCHGTLTEPPLTAVITDTEELAMREGRLNNIPLQVGDRVLVTDRGEKLGHIQWPLTSTVPVLTMQVTHQVYTVPLVMGSRCPQKADEQASHFCHECHAVNRP
jgi:hypothetical protein